MDFPLGTLTAVTGVSGSGKSTLVGQVLAETLRAHLGPEADGAASAADQDADGGDGGDGGSGGSGGSGGGSAGTEGVGPGDEAEETTVAEAEGLEHIERLVRVDQKPIGRTPRSNLATYTGLFDGVRRLFAAQPLSRERGYTAGRFSFNVAEGRCPNCQGEGVVSVEMLFLPTESAPCPVCGGARYNPETLEVTVDGLSVADVLALTVDDARPFLKDLTPAARVLDLLAEIGLGYLTLGQSATTLSGGEAQRIKLVGELQRAPRGHTLYLLDEPTTGLHPADVGPAAGAAPAARGRGAHGGRGGARPARGGGRGLDDRPGSGRRDGRGAGGRRGHPGGCGPQLPDADRRVSAAASGRASGEGTQGAVMTFHGADALDGARWIHGARRPARSADPAIQVLRYDDQTFIMRQSKAVHYEAPFLFLLVGSERALLLDTGASPDPARFPLRATVDGLIGDRELVVAHTHSHGDHVAGDGQFADRPGTTIVGHKPEDVRAFFGFEEWPDSIVEFDLGDRVLELIGSPGHHATAVTFYDPRSEILFTGDTVMPARLYTNDYPAFLATLDRLVSFVASRPVRHVLGCHVEMTTRPERDYPLGARYQPDEVPPQMTAAALVTVRNAAHGAADRRGVHAFRDFVIYNEAGRWAMTKLVARGVAGRVMARVARLRG